MAPRESYTTSEPSKPSKPDGPTDRHQKKLGSISGPAGGGLSGGGGDQALAFRWTAVTRHQLKSNSAEKNPKKFSITFTHSSPPEKNFFRRRRRRSYCRVFKLWRQQRRRGRVSVSPTAAPGLHLIRAAAAFLSKATSWVSNEPTSPRQPSNNQRCSLSAPVGRR